MWGFLHQNSPGETEKHTSVLREALSTYFIAKNPYKAGLRRRCATSHSGRYNEGRPGFFFEGRRRSLNNKIRAWPRKKLLYIEGGGQPLEVLKEKRKEQAYLQTSLLP